MKCDQTSVFHRNWYFEFKMLLNLKAKIAFNSLNWDDSLKLEKFCFYTSHYAVENRNEPQSGPESVEEESSKTKFCKNLSQK